MLIPKHAAAPATPEERRLIHLYRGLDETDRHALIAFAEFLTQRKGAAQMPQPPREPTPLARTKGETVIAAIRRLSLSYCMLDRGSMLHETAALMSAHVLKGRGAPEVIDDLEALFERHYQAYRTPMDPDATTDDEAAQPGVGGPG